MLASSAVSREIGPRERSPACRSSDLHWWMDLAAPPGDEHCPLGLPWMRVVG